MNYHRILPVVVAVAVGVLLSLYAYQRVTDPEPAMQRGQEEAVVIAARDILRNYVARSADLDIVDPLQTNRAIGKTYIYPTPTGWQVSGHYQRPSETRWHPWLMTLDGSRQLQHLKVQDGDPGIKARAADDPRFTAEH